jgi:hypothetical protein
MVRRLRLGPTSGPKLLGWAVAAVLVLALVLTGRLLGGDSGRRPPASAAPITISTQTPYRIGNTVQCPPNWPVLATANHTSYPAGHPATPPPSATAVACYHTAAQAAGAGYPPAPLPPGMLEVGGVYLTPTIRAFRASCQRVADRLGFAIPCPGLLPKTRARSPRQPCTGPARCWQPAPTTPTGRSSATVCCCAGPSGGRWW